MPTFRTMMLIRLPSPRSNAKRPVPGVAALVAWGGLLVPALVVAAPPVPSRRPAPVQYNRDVRPILSENCFPCHGPDPNKRQAGLRLDVCEEALRRGVLSPGHPERSRLIERVTTPTAARRMPPAAFHKSLTGEHLMLLRRWVAEGAPYQAHWAYVPPQRPAAPKLTDPRYPTRGAVDAFVRAKLAEQRILPSPEADRRTLLRRVTLDLTGLPPTPEEVEAFAADRSAAAYEKVVARLLASPHYGERMATPWLDVVRYADTVGFHGDQNQNAWAYRDYVVQSFNRNKRFDDFTREQLAGDLLPHPTSEQRAATCFNRLNMVTREGGAQAKEYLAKYAADRVRTVGMTWFGSTLGCAECHDHKYDPFTTRDFYSIAAFFADVKQWGVYADYGYTPNPELRGYNNDSPFPPEIQVESPSLKQRVAHLQGKLRAVARTSAPVAEVQRWREGVASFLGRHAEGWEALEPEAAISGDATQARLGDGSVRLSDGATAVLTLTARPTAPRLAALRLELLPRDGDGTTVFRKGMEGTTLALSATLQRAGGRSEAIAFRHAGANYSEPRYRSGQALVGVQAGWKLSAAKGRELHDSVWLPVSPPQLGPGDALVVTLPNVPAARVRLSVSPLAPEDPDTGVFPAAVLTALGRNGPLDDEIALTWLRSAGPPSPAFAQVKSVEAELWGCRKGWTPVMVTEAWAPTPVRVLPRGNWQDEKGALVEPTPPGFLLASAPAPAAGRRLTRLDLADWLVSPNNPLTARVFVNRLWKQFFGNALSGLVEDLGAQGEWPSHPELLDWLAVEFQESGWDVKHMVRLLVTSHTYRQSSSLRPELHARDPQNRWLASQNPRRLEAEFVRDNALAIAGLLQRDVGGPPSKPYQPEGYYSNLQFPDRPYEAERDERQWRRGLYVHWQRTFLHPMLVNFDAPSREDCAAARTVANTPQQALTLLNDPTFVEAARSLAALVLPEPGADEQRLDRLLLRAVSRPARPAERRSLLAFLQQVRSEYRARPDDARKSLRVGVAAAPANGDPVELASWTALCRVVLNLQETITRY